MSQIEAGDRAPWPYWTQKAAARRLGVSIEFLSGLTNHKFGANLRSVLKATPSGRLIRVYCKRDVDALAEALAKGGER